MYRQEFIASFFILSAKPRSQHFQQQVVKTTERESNRIFVIALECSNLENKWNKLLLRAMWCRENMENYLEIWNCYKNKKCHSNSKYFTAEWPRNTAWRHNLDQTPTNSTSSESQIRWPIIIKQRITRANVNVYRAAFFKYLHNSHLNHHRNCIRRVMLTFQEKRKLRRDIC